MGQPFYETPADVARERAIAEEAQRVWCCPLVKLKTAFPCDWGAIRADGQLRAFVEIKDRNGYSLRQLDELGGVFFSLMKWSQCEHLCRLADRPFIFVVRLAGVLWFHHTWSRYMSQHDGVRNCGRSDRGDPDDIEPCVLLRAHRFKQLSEPL